jgi:hypothetical protein
MLMILPLRWGTITLAASWLISNAAVRLTATVASHLSRPKSSTSPSGQMPALLTRMSTVPNASTQDSTTRAGSPARVMSVSRKANCCPVASMSCRVVPSSSAKLGTNTLAPAAASALANPWPSPELPPVTIADFPDRSNQFIEKSVIDIAMQTTAPTSLGLQLVGLARVGLRPRSAQAHHWHETLRCPRRTQQRAQGSPCSSGRWFVRSHGELNARRSRPITTPLDALTRTSERSPLRSQRMVALTLGGLRR